MSVEGKLGAHFNAFIGGHGSGALARQRPLLNKTYRSR